MERELAHRAAGAAGVEPARARAEEPSRRTGAAAAAAARTEPATWACPTCTFVNKLSSKACSMCGALQEFVHPLLTYDEKVALLEMESQEKMQNISDFFTSSNEQFVDPSFPPIDRFVATAQQARSPAFVASLC